VSLAASTSLSHTTDTSEPSDRTSTTRFGVAESTSRPRPVATVMGLSRMAVSPGRRSPIDLHSYWELVGTTRAVVARRPAWGAWVTSQVMYDRVSSTEDSSIAENGLTSSKSSHWP